MIQRKDKPQFSTEQELTSKYVVPYLEDLLNLCGLSKVAELRREMEIQSLRRDLIVIMMSEVPILCIEVKKPKEQILTNKKILSHLVDSMLQIRHFHGMGHVFGVLTTFNEWRICWLSDSQDAAESSSFISYHKAIASSSMRPHVIHGTEVISGQDTALHSILISVILKSVHCYHTKSCRYNVSLSDSQRAFIIVEKHGFSWGSLPRDFTWSLSLFPFRNSQKFYLIKDLKGGSEGRVWLATNTSGRLCVIKFFQKGAMSRAKKEESIWHDLGFTDVFTVQLVDAPVLVMHPAITCQSDGIGFETSVLDAVAPCLDEKQAATLYLELRSYEPMQLLDEALKLFMDHDISHEDLAWRHVALAIVKNQLRPTFIDVGDCVKGGDYIGSTMISRVRRLQKMAGKVK